MSPNLKPDYSPYGDIKLLRMLKLPMSSRHCVFPWMRTSSRPTGIWSLRWTMLRMRTWFSISPPVMPSFKKALMAVEEFWFTGNCNHLTPSSMLCGFSAQLPYARVSRYLQKNSLLFVHCGGFSTKLALFKVTYSYCSPMKTSSDYGEHHRFNMPC